MTKLVKAHTAGTRAKLTTLFTTLWKKTGISPTETYALGRAELLKFGLAGSAVFFFNAIIYTYNEIKKKMSKKIISPTGNGV